MLQATMPEPRRPYLKLVAIGIFFNWLPPGITYLLTGSAPALFLAASITSIFLGSLFLLFCFPLGRLVNEVQQQFKFNPMAWVMDLLVRHNFPPLRWPRSSRGWTLACIVLAVYSYITAVFCFFWATGNSKAEHALTNWLDRMLHTLF